MPKRRKSKRVHMNYRGHPFCGQEIGDSALVPDWILVTCKNCQKALRRKITNHQLLNLLDDSELAEYIEQNKLTQKHMSELLNFMGNTTKDRMVSLWTLITIMKYYTLDLTEILHFAHTNHSILEICSIQNVPQRLSLLGMSSRIYKSPTLRRERKEICEYMLKYGYFLYKEKKR